MREFIVGKDIKSAARLDEYILSVFPALPKNVLYKAFRKKDVKIGGRWAAPDAILAPFSVVRVYLSDEILFGGKPGAKQSIAHGSQDFADSSERGIDDATLKNSGGLPAGGFSVIYEDKRLLIVNKAQGLPVHPDRGGGGVTLIELVREYLERRLARRGDSGADLGQSHGRFSNRGTNGDDVFDPAMCHRLDRNTGGLVAIAKDREALKILLEKFSSGDIKKEYRCIVYGKPDPPQATLRSYLTKDPSRGKVSVIPPDMEPPGYAREIVTGYRTVNYDPTSNTSKLEVTLLTGRTHQIRAHLASVGNPIIGDGKYCPNSINKLYYAPYQLLVAFRLTFPGMPGLDVSGKVVEIPDGLSHPAPAPRRKAQSR